MQCVMLYLQCEYSVYGGWEYLCGDSDCWVWLLCLDLVYGYEGFVLLLFDQIGVFFCLGLFDVQYWFVVGNLDVISDDELYVVQVDGYMVGWLGMVLFQIVIVINDLNFYNIQMCVWWVIGIVLLLVMVLLVWLVLCVLCQCLVKLVVVIYWFVVGDYVICIECISDDELDVLVNDFNWMVQVLDDIECNCCVFIVDILYELCMLLVVVCVELEVIEDGICLLDCVNFGVLQGEIC